MNTIKVKLILRSVDGINFWPVHVYYAEDSKTGKLIDKDLFDGKIYRLIEMNNEKGNDSVKPSENKEKDVS